MIMAYVIVCHLPPSSLPDLLEYEAATLQLAMESFTPLVAQSLSLHPQLFQLLLSLMGVDTPCSRLVESPLLLVLHQVLEVHEYMSHFMFANLTSCAFSMPFQSTYQHTHSFNAQPTLSQGVNSLGV